MPLEFKMYSYIGPEPLRTSIPLLSTRKSTASSSAQSPTTPGGLPPPPEFATSYQLDIISALRGHSHNFLSRSAVVDGILGIECEENKLQLIDFLTAEQGAIAVTLENNACKLFECTPGELFIAAQREESDPAAFLAKLIQLFHTTLHRIIPNAFGMLYPLQQFDSTFQIRQIILHYFRDRVLLSLLDNFHFERQIFRQNPELEANLRQMFLLINLDVRDESDEAECFEQIKDDFFGKAPKNPRKSWSKWESEEFGKAIAPIRKIGMSIKPISSRGRRAQRSAVSSVANSPPPEEADTHFAKAIAASNNSPGWRPAHAVHRYRKSFSPSPKLFMATKEKEEEERKREEAERPMMVLERKERARTMPSKTVTFWDQEGQERE